MSEDESSNCDRDFLQRRSRHKPLKHDGPDISTNHLLDSVNEMQDPPRCVNARRATKKKNNTPRPQRFVNKNLAWVEKGAGLAHE